MDKIKKDNNFVVFPTRDKFGRKCFEIKYCNQNNDFGFINKKEKNKNAN